MRTTGVVPVSALFCFLSLSGLVFLSPGIVVPSNLDVPVYPDTGGPTIVPEPELARDCPPGVSEDGLTRSPVPPELTEPIGRGLLDTIAGMDPSEPVRVIVFLAYQPQDVVAAQVQSRHAGAMAELRARSKALRAGYAALRRTPPGADADEHGLEDPPMSAEDRAALRALNQEHEALSLVIARETSLALGAAVAPSQQQVLEVIEELGGEVEHRIRATNALVAWVPARSIPDIAAQPMVSRVVGDQAMRSSLTYADDATLVTTDAGDGSLWDNGYTGGLYDPAVIDTGTDLSHPFMVDGTSWPRTNYSGVFLDSAQDMEDFDDDADSVDDLVGHGTHVAGIVASHGSDSFPAILGMSFGVEKLVTLKAGYRKTNGEGTRLYSDVMRAVDVALHDTGLLDPSTFSDDVDGFNYSAGSAISTDDSDWPRFFDSVVSSHLDIVMTISAGNHEDDNIYIESPGISYNSIAVANVDDDNTPERTDDVIYATSCIGPTVGNRRKPDIAAPGTHIASAHYRWEDTTYPFSFRTGTSMAAPMILGIAMDLMDAGVWDEKEVKALLLNSALKNDTLIDFESDDDGWDERYGWGYVNAYHAYFHRNDVFTDSVTERPTSGYYRLYSGRMGDNINMGRDRATLVWNRPATYKPEDYPDTYYALSDLNIRLYDETNDDLIDYDWATDNVHQVRVPEGAPLTDVVVKVYAWSEDFPHGGTVQPYSLATEENFVQVSFPTSFQGISMCPSEVEPNEVFDCEFWMRNNSDIASHNNQFDLFVPSGWTLVSGADPFAAGSIPGEGDTSSHAVWRLQAQSTPQDGVTLGKLHTHSSYAESYTGPIWVTTVNVRVDSTPPTPDPMAWATQPYELGPSEIRMVAVTASDIHGPVQYLFDFTSSPTGGTGGSDSGFTTSTAYVDSSLQPNEQYCYRVLARDAAATPNSTSYSSTSCDYTAARPPTAEGFSKVTSTSIQVNWGANGNPAGTEYFVENTTKGTSFGWTTALLWRERRLQCETSYSYRAKARNGDSAETAWIDLGTKSTKRCRPGGGG